MNSFESKAQIVGNIEFPNFKNTRIMMMPFYLYDLNTLPDNLKHYKETIKQLINLVPKSVEQYEDTPAYLTIDERLVCKEKYKEIQVYMLMVCIMVKLVVLGVV